MLSLVFFIVVHNWTPPGWYLERWSPWCAPDQTIEECIAYVDEDA